MVERARVQGCCSAPDCPTNFDERVDLGQRRLILLRRISAAGSVLCCAAALVLLVAGMEMADRFAWAAAVWGLPRLLGYTREALSERRVPVPLLVAVPLVVVGVLGWPIVTAIGVATVLVVDLFRRDVRPAGRPAGSLPNARVEPAQPA